MTGAPTLDALGLPVDEAWLHLYDLDLRPRDPDWPRLHTVAYQGLVGDAIRLLAPSSEADPAAIAVTLLAFFGSAVGPGPHVYADGVRHTARINVVKVGATADARKGTATARARSIFEVADPGWHDNCIKSGFGSAEALVDEVADDREDVDKRLLVLEGEFVRVLAVAAREGSTLSAMIRDAWDLDRLAARSRQKRTVATGAHVSFVADVTVEELRRRLSETEMANGMANRWLFACAHRARLLPSGGEVDPDALYDVGMRFRSALEIARRVTRVRRTPVAESRWEQLYRAMAHKPKGLAGALTARAEPQCLRLSLIYALLDGARSIDIEHLEAAYAVWQYCEASVLHVFGESLGDDTADRLYEAIRVAGDEGLGFTEQSEVFGRNVSSKRLAAARAELEGLGLIETVRVPTTGRPRLVSRTKKEERRPRR